VNMPIKNNGLKIISNGSITTTASLLATLLRALTYTRSLFKTCLMEIRSSKFVSLMGVE
jgi:hypothetical protein